MYFPKSFVLLAIVWGTNAQFAGWGPTSLNDETPNDSDQDDPSSFAGWGASLDDQEDQPSFTGWGSPNSNDESSLDDQDEQSNGDDEGDDQEEQSNGDDEGDDDDSSESRDSRSTPSILKAALDQHNLYRRRHKVPDLKLDSAITNKAQKYANYLASNNLFTHSTDKKYGENLSGSVKKSKEAAVRDAVDRWYNEIKLYNWKNPKFTSGTGHFSAVVWKASTRLGVGIAWNPKKQWWVVVANYSPAGNTAGKFKHNVLTPK